MKPVPGISEKRIAVVIPAYRAERHIAAVLAGIPELEVAEIPEGSLCCGSAGIYNMLQPETANQLGSRKVENLLSTDAQAVLSANPGCLLQLMNGLRQRRLKAMPAFHMVELLDASIRGISIEALLQGKNRSAH